MKWGRLTAILFFFISVVAFADDQNYQNYVVGEAAAGMGGAYTAFSESSEGTLYNPGGVAFAKHDRISLSANAVRLTMGTLNGAVKVGGVKKNLQLNAIQVIPASSVGLHTFNFKWDKPKNPETKMNAIALSFYYPDLVRYSGKTEISEGGIEGLFTYRIDDSLLLAGPTYSRRINDTIGVGVSVFYAYRKFIRETANLATNGVAFQESFNNDEFTYGGLVEIIGGKWRFAPNWHTGLSLRPPALRLHGSGDAYSATATQAAVSATNPDKNVLKNLDVNLPPPMKVTAGIGYCEENHFAIDGDVSFYFPDTFSAVHDPQGRTTDVTIKQNWILNGNVGGEYWLTPHWPLRAGLFTNFSSAPDLGSAGSNGTKIDYYGSSVSVANVQSNYTTQLGVQMSYGSGKTQVGADINNFSLLHITAMVAGSFQF